MPRITPLMTTKVLVYGYSVGITSSRRMAQALDEQVAFRFLSANQSPDFCTIADFRRRHLTALQRLFVQILKLCREAGLVTMGRVALDGRKVATNAALDQSRTMQGIKREVRRILEEAERRNQADPENRILKTCQGWLQGYNGQAMADCTSLEQRQCRAGR